MLIIAQVIVSIVLIVFVLLQERGAGLGSLFGGGGGGTPYQTRRGLEKIIYWGTIVAAIVWAALALLHFIL